MKARFLQLRFSTGILLATALAHCHWVMNAAAAPVDAAQVIQLPQPRREGPVSLESAMQQRRSVREFSAAALTLAEVSQLLWAAQGVTDPSGHRTVPSAGAIYPLELFVVAGNVDDLPAGVYRYRPREHDLLRVAIGDRRNRLSAAAQGQGWVTNAPAAIVITGQFEMTARRYKEQAPGFVCIEAGHAAQNLELQAVALGLGTTFVGAVDEARLARVLGIIGTVKPVGLLPVGRPRKP